MPSEQPVRRLADIVDNIGLIAQYIGDMELTAFEDDSKTRDAVERCLERITEAATKPGPLAVELMPDQPWQKIRALGNRLRHEYDAIREDRLWDIVHADLPSLLLACENAIRDLEKN